MKKLNTVIFDSRKGRCQRNKPKINQTCQRICQKLLTSPYTCVGLARELGLSRQCVSKWLKWLSSYGFAHKETEGYNAVWKADTKQLVNAFSQGVREPQTVYTHHIGYKFPIIKPPKIGFPQEIKVKNWTKGVTNLHGCTIERTPKHLIFWAVPRYGSDPFEVQDRMLWEIFRIAQEICDRHDAVLGEPARVGKPHFAPTSPVVKKFAQNMRVSTEMGDMDDSEDIGGHLDYYDPQDAADFIRLPRHIREVKKLIASGVNQSTAIANTNMLTASTQSMIGKMLNRFEKRLKKIELALYQRTLKEFRK